MSASITWFNVLGLPLTGCQKFLVRSREFASSFWLNAPSSHDHTPNRVLQPLILPWVNRTGRSLTTENLLSDRGVISFSVREYLREDLGQWGIVLSDWMFYNGGAYRKRSHAKGVDITLFRRTADSRKPNGIQKTLRCHIPQGL